MLEDLGNLGDFIGGLAVVATLAYLAIQVRQNTTQLRRSADLAAIEAGDLTVRAFSRFRAQIISNTEVAELYLRGLRDPGALRGSDRLRFNLLVQELFYILSTSTRRFLATTEYDVDQTFRVLGVPAMLTQPGIADWWKANKDDLPLEFVEQVEAHLAAASPSVQHDLAG
jgi:hypothetical protein